MAKQLPVNPYDKYKNEPYDPNRKVDLRPEMSEFNKGLHAFADETQALGGGLVSLGAEHLRPIVPDVVEEKVINPVSQWGMETYKENMEESTYGKQAPNIAKVEEIKGVGDFGDWAGYQLGKGLPQLAGLGLGGVAGRQIAKKGIKEGVERAAKAKVGSTILGREITEGVKKKAKDEIRKRLDFGTKAGGFTAGALMEGGHAFGEAIDEEVDPQRAKWEATAVGGINGALEFLPLYQVAKKLGRGAFAKESIRDIIKDDKPLRKMAMELAKRSLKAGGAGFATEGVTEGLQELTNIAGLRWAKEDPMFADLEADDWSRIGNAIAAGGLVGGTVGGVTGPFKGPEGVEGTQDEPTTEPAIEPVIEPQADLPDFPEPIVEPIVEPEPAPVVASVAPGVSTGGLEINTTETVNLGQDDKGNTVIQSRKDDDAGKVASEVKSQGSFKEAGSFDSKVRSFVSEKTALNAMQREGITDGQVVSTDNGFTIQRQQPKDTKAEPITELHTFASPRQVGKMYDIITAVGEGKTAEQIRQDYGAFVGDDGKWRVEIDDSQGKFSLAKWRNQNKTLRNKGIDPYNLTVGTFLDHPELFAAYPETKDIKIVRDKTLNKDELGWFNYRSNTIGINSKIHTPAYGSQDPYSTILHEVQHWIQHKEGFAVGGNDTTVWTDLSAEQKDQVKEEVNQAAQADIDDLVKAQAFLDKIKDDPVWADFKIRRESDGYISYNEIEGIYKEAIGKDFKQGEIARTIRDNLRGDRDVPRLSDQVNSIVAKMQQAQKGDIDALRNLRNTYSRNFQLYERLAGETEARLTEARMALDRAARMLIHPDETRANHEDVKYGKDKTFVVFDEGADTTPDPQPTGITPDVAPVDLPAFPVDPEDPIPDAPIEPIEEPIEEPVVEPTVEPTIEPEPIAEEPTIEEPIVEKPIVEPEPEPVIEPEPITEPEPDIFDPANNPDARTAESLREDISNVLGAKLVATLEELGALTITDETHGTYGWDGPQGGFSTATGTVTLYGGSWHKDASAAGVFLHEGAHMNLDKMLGGKLGGFVRDIQRQAEIGNTIARQAIGKAASEKALREAEGMIVPDFFLNEETAAYYIQYSYEQGGQTGLTNRLFNGIKAGFRQSWLGRLFASLGMGVELNPAMAVEYAKRSAQQTAEVLQDLERLGAPRVSKYTAGSLNSIAQPSGKQSKMASKLMEEDSSGQIALRDTGIWKDSKGNLHTFVEERDIFVKDNLDIGKVGKLEDVLESSALFNLYPDLKSHKVKFVDMAIPSQLSGDIIQVSDKFNNKSLKGLKPAILMQVDEVLAMKDGWRGFTPEVNLNEYPSLREIHSQVVDESRASDMGKLSLAREVKRAVRDEQLAQHMDMELFSRGYHGSPADINQFSTDFIGEGEGAQRWGWGLYFTDSKSIAEWYRNKLADEGEGHIYQVDLKPEEKEYLVWDMPLSEQSHLVKQALITNGLGGLITSGMTGGKLYKNMAKFHRVTEDWIHTDTGYKGTSLELLGYGVRGVKYLDGNSRGQGEGDYNYVIFDDKDVEIEARNDELYSRVHPNDKFYYSELTKQVEGIKQAKAPATQWKAMISKLAQKGVKSEEITWSQVNDWLDKQDGSVAKKDVVKYLKEQEVQILETMKGTIFPREKKLRLKDLGKSLRIYAKANDYLGFDSVMDVFNSIVQYEDWPARWDVTDPEFIEIGNEYRALYKESQMDTPVHEQYTTEGNYSDYREILLRLPEGSEVFKSPEVHWTEKNVLAFTRFNTRMIDGKKTLFIEEIQSDWHQAGKKQGYGKTNYTTNELTKQHINVTELLKDNYIAFDSDINLEKHELYGLRKWQTDEEITPNDLPTNIKVEYDKLVEMAKNVRANPLQLNVDNIPEAPFKNTPAWSGVALKRLMRYATDNGFEQIGWTSGKIQNERYNLDNPKGMEDFYDKIIPNVFNKLGKKLGAKTGVGSLYIKDSLGLSTRQLKAKGYDKYPFGFISSIDSDVVSVEDTKTGKVIDFPNREEADAYVTEEIARMFGKKEDVWTAPVTDKMKERTPEGFALFSRTGNTDITDGALADLGKTLGVDIEATRPVDMKELNSVLSEMPAKFKDLKSWVLTDPDNPAEKYKLGWAQRLYLQIVDSFETIRTKAINIYDEYDLAESRKASQVDEINRRFFNPLKEMVKELDIPVQEVNDWLAARHILLDDVNMKMAERASNDFVKRLIKHLPKDAKKEVREAKAVIEAGASGKNATIPVEQARRMMYDLMNKYSTEEVPHAEPGTNDEKTQMIHNEWQLFKQHASGMFTEGEGLVNTKGAPDAKAIYNRYRDNTKMQDIGKKYSEMTRHQLELLRDGHLITEKEMNIILADKVHYVPLRREAFDYETAFDFLENRGVGPAKGLTTRFGSATLNQPIHVIQNGLANTHKAAAAGQKNLANEYLYQEVTSNRNKWRDWFTAQESEFRPTMDSLGFVQRGKDDARPNDIILTHKGKRLIITPVEQNERASLFTAAVNKLGAKQQSSVLRMFGMVNNFVRTTAVSASPPFLLANMIRDPLTAVYNMQASEAKEYTSAIVGEYKNVMQALINVYWKEDRSDNADTRLIEEWEKAGGRISFVQSLKEMDAGIKSFEGAVKWGKTQGVKQVMKAFDNIEKANIIVENVMRLSTFKVMKDKVGHKRAARISKDLTTNFTRKGFMSSNMGMLYLFFNATVQGNVQVVKNLMGSKKLVGLVGGTITTAFIFDLLGRALADDDEWDQIPSYEKERNIVLPFKVNGVYPKIPAPWVYNVAWRLGGMIGENVAGVRTSADTAIDSTAMMFTTFNPMGGGTLLQALSPTALDPIAQWAENKNFAGNPLRPDNFPGASQKADAELAWGSTPESYKWIAKYLNEGTGGDAVHSGWIDVSPATIKNTVEFFGAGMWKFGSNVLGMPAELAKEDTQVRKLPVLRQFAYEPTNQVTVQQYYERVEEVKSAEKSIKIYSKGAGKDAGRLMEARDKYKDVLRMGMQVKDTERQLKSLRVRLRAAQGRNDEQTEQRLQDKIASVQKRFNQVYDRRVKE